MKKMTTAERITLVRKQRGNFEIQRVCDWCRHERVISLKLHHTTMCRKHDIAIVSQDMAKNCEYFSPEKED